MMTFFQASHITQWEKCQGWKLRNLHKIIVHTYLWFWLRYINLNIIKNFIIIKCLLFFFFVHNYFFVKIIFRTVKCKLDDYSAGLKKTVFIKDVSFIFVCKHKMKKCLCYKKLSASVFQWKIIPHFYFLQYR